MVKNLSLFLNCLLRLLLSRSFERRGRQSSPYTMWAFERAASFWASLSMALQHEECAIASSVRVAKSSVYIRVLDKVTDRLCELWVWARKCMLTKTMINLTVSRELYPQTNYCIWWCIVLVFARNHAHHSTLQNLCPDVLHSCFLLLFCLGSQCTDAV